MKISRNILGIWVVTVITACGFNKQKEIQNPAEKSVQAKISSQGEGFDLAGSTFKSISDGSALTSSTNSLSCSNNSNDGIESIGSYDLNAQSVEFKITIDRSTPGNKQVFKIKSPQSTLELYTFEYGSLDQLKAKVGSGIAHRNYPSDTMHIKVDFTSTTATVKSFEGGRWINFASFRFSASNNVRVEYLCGNGLGSTIKDLYIAGVPQDLALGSESTDGSSTDGSSTDGSSTDGSSTDGSSTDGSSAGGSGSSNDLVITGSGSDMSSATNSLTCPSSGDNSGIESNNSFDFTGGEVTVKLNIDVNDSSHKQWFVVENGSNNAFIRLFRWGNSYQLKAGKNSQDLVHTNFGANNIKYLKIFHEAGPKRVTMGVSSDGNMWSNFAFISYTTPTNNMKLVYKCGTSLSTITDLKINGVQQNLDVVGGNTDGSGGGGNTDGSGGTGTTDGASGGGNTDGTDGSSTDGASGGGAGGGPQYDLIWSDEFNGNSINMNNWNHEVNCWGGGNNEDQCYVNSSANSYVSDGTLKIKAIKGATTGPNCQDGNCSNMATRNYSSARLTTQNKFTQKYGKFCARIKLPMGKRVWPAFWMLPNFSQYIWAVDGEIDIMEAVHPPSNPNMGTEVHGTLHYGGEWPANVYSGTEYHTPTNASRNFQTYCTEWEDGEIRWFVNDVHFATQRQWFSRYPNGSVVSGTATPFNSDFFMILNVAIGGAWPDNVQPQDPNESDVTTSTTMEVDWVRVYECAANPSNGKGCSTVGNANLIPGHFP